MPKKHISLSFLFITSSALLAMDCHQKMLNYELVQAVNTNAQPHTVVEIINSGAFTTPALAPAVEHGNTRLLQLLLKYGANIHGCNRNLVAQGNPSLFERALLSQHAKKTIKMLSAYGLKPTTKDYKTACLHNFSMIDELIKYGIDPDTAVDSYNHTSLMGLATCYSAYPLPIISAYATRLVWLGADIDHTNTEGKTALILCVQAAHSPQKYAIAKILLTLGANPLICDYAGNSALDYTHDATELSQLISDGMYVWINKEY